MARPAKRARGPSWRSMRMTSFHLAMRSPRVKEPTLSWPALVALPTPQGGRRLDGAMRSQALWSLQL